jgi:hypothetical protein
MTTRFILSIDGGKSTGTAFFSYSDAQPARLVRGWQFSGGVGAFVDWAKEQLWSDKSLPFNGVDYPELTIVAERFVPLTGKGFSQTSDSVEPLRVEGAMIALGLMPADYSDTRWARPAAMYWAGGDTLADKKKRLRAWLKEHDMYLTGKDLGAPDNNDFVSAAAHGVAYFRRTNHIPTLEAYFG